VRESLVCEGSVLVGNAIEQSVIGIRSRIDQGVTLRRSLLAGADFYETAEEIESACRTDLPPIGIGQHSLIENAIIDKNCRIGNDVRINGGSHLANSDHSLYTVKDGIVVVKKGAILPDGFVI
jgi:glucose-1-phosphate adenylyltransferase